MKKILFLFLAVIGLSLTSCSTEEQVGQASAKTIDVALNVSGEGTTSTTGKQVKQGNIPASVKLIRVKTTLSGVTKTYEQFDLVPNSTQNVENNFILNDVPVGNNTLFEATTETAATPYNVLAPTSGTPKSVLITLKAHVPYVIYDGSATKNVSGTGVNVIDIDMNTLNGRILTVFKLDDDNVFKGGFEATITAKIYNANGTTELGSAGPTKVQNSGLVYFEWSNKKALAGNKVVYTVDVTPVNNNNNKHTIYTIEQVIKASTSISCIYTITKDKAPSPYISENKIVFKFQQWVEENCPDYPNCK